MRKLFLVATLAVLGMASCTSPSQRRADSMVFIPNEDVVAVSFISLTATEDEIVISGVKGANGFRAITSNYANAWSVNEFRLDSLGGKHDLHIGYFVRYGDMIWEYPPVVQPESQNISSN